jgi:hypothetical protein
MPQNVVIAGGGLAGLACAFSLARADFDVVLCESSPWLGGKAGARPSDPLRDRFPYPIEHGPHFFPGWYRNVRYLMGLTGSLARLVDYDRLTYLMPPGHSGAGRPVVLRMGGSRGLLRLAADQLYNLFRGPLPWPGMMQSACSVFDLMTASLDRSRVSDQVSLLGFYRCRWYADDRLAGFHQAHVLRGSAVPAHAVCAGTVQALLRLWFRYPTPFLSVLDTDLGRGLIDPLAAAMGERVRVRLETPVAGLRMRHGKAAGLRLADGNEVDADVTVLAVPIEVIRRFVDDEVYTADRELTRINLLESLPMAALHVAFATEIAGIPEGVVYLWDSPLSLNLIDLSQVWRSLTEGRARQPRRTVLSVICADWKRLQSLSREAQVRALLGELARYVPAARPELVEGVELLDNVDRPLFINTAGSWLQRPSPGPRAYERSPDIGLYVTGDFARNAADVACMEGAVLAGFETAAAIARQAGRDPGIVPLSLASYDRGRALLYRLAKWGCAPGALVARLSGGRPHGREGP